MDRRLERDLAELRRGQTVAARHLHEVQQGQIQSALELATQALAGLVEFDDLVERVAPSLEEHAWAIKDALVVALAQIISAK